MASAYPLRPPNVAIAGRAIPAAVGRLADLNAGSAAREKVDNTMLSLSRICRMAESTIFWH